MSFLHHLKNKLFDLFLPRACFVCKKSGTYFCRTCFGNLDAPHDEQHDLPAWIFPLKSYKNPALRNALWKLKYKGTQALANDFGPHLYEGFLALYGEEELRIGGHTLYIVPIPLSRVRLRERGYNQAELLARALTRAGTPTDFVIADILRKTKNTEPQAKIKRRHNRLANMRDVFAVKPNTNVENAVIFLIDDIVTTGATLKDARRALLAAGASRVYAITVAH